MWGEKKIEKGKGGKYSEKEFFFVRRRRTEKEKRKIFGEGKYVSVEEKKNGDELRGSKKGGGLVSLIFFYLLNFIVEVISLFKLYV